MAHIQTYMTTARSFFLMLALAASATWASAASAASEELLFTTEDLPPFNMLDKNKATVIGIAADKVNEIMLRTKLPYKIELLPWARAYQMAQDSPRTCVFSTTRTALREAKFKWVGPLVSSSWAMYGLKDRKFTLATLEDAKNLTIGTYNADVRDGYLRDKGFKVETAMRDELNPRKLLAGRIDLWASGTFEAPALLVPAKLTDRIVPVFKFNQVELYLACNLGMADDLIARMNSTLTAMVSDGMAAKIELHYKNWPN